MARKQLKRYLYISQTKVDQAFEQIREPILRRIALSLRLNLPPFGLDVKADRRRDSLIARLRVVEEHLATSGAIGTVDAPLTYFRASMSMVEAEIGGEKPILLYAGRDAGALVALTGSISNAIGRRELEPAGSVRASLEDAFEREVRPRAPKRTTVSAARPASMEPAELVAWVLDRRSRVAQEVEFVAEKFAVSSQVDAEGQPAMFVQGTPLYVALAG
jgi:hypothetical protein